MPNQHGDFIWYELITKDTEAALRFYGEVVGWTATPFGDNSVGGAYLVWHADGIPVGGLTSLPADAGEMPPAWFGYVAVNDVDAIVSAMEADGATTMMAPMSMPGVGRMALVADPQGVPIYVMRGESQESSTAFSSDIEGRCAWNELATDDPDAAMAFHFKHFGWTKGDPIPMGEAGVYQLFNQGESAIGAIMRRSPQAPSCWSYYFRVPSIAAAKERVETAGGTVIVGPMEVPGGDEILVCTDPQGAMFCLVGKSGTA